MIRIELLGHGHDSPAYTRLHEAMATKGVSRTIKSEVDGKYFQLPIGSYSYSGVYETVAVRDWIISIVDGLNYQHYVIVTGGDSAWALKQL